MNEGKPALLRMDTRYAIVGSQLYRRRMALNLRLQDVAAACGWSKQYYWRLENGVVSSIGEEAAQKLCAVLGDDLTG